MNQNDTRELTGFGYHTAEEVQELQKALSVGGEYTTTLPGSLSGGPALAVEDLDRTLKLVTASLEELVLWKDIIKQKQTQMVAQYNVQNAYGAEVSPFFAMGTNPQATDAAYNRDVFQVKFLGTQGSVQHNLTLIQAAHGPVVAREVKNKTVELLQRNERAMIDADSAINSLEYDGLDTQIRTKGSDAKYIHQGWVGYESTGVDDSAVKDVRVAGAAVDLDQDINEDASLRCLNNHGRPKAMYLPTDVHSRYSRSFYLAQRTVPGAMQPSGWYTPDFRGTLKFDFRPSIFLRPRKVPLAVAVGAGAAPTIANLLSPSDPDSKFASGDAGTYSYVVSAVFADGETLPCSQSAVAVSAGDKVTIEISFSGTPLYFNIFRAPVGTTTGHKFIGRVAKGTSAAAHDVDFNGRLPGSARAYLLMNDPDVLVWRQLGSLIKYDLAVTTTAYQWLQLIYGGTLVMAARKSIIIDNLA